MRKIAHCIACLAFAALLANCSCAIESEYWRNESKLRVTHQTVTDELRKSGFQLKSAQSPWTYEKGYSAFVKFDEHRQILRFQNSFCPNPWEWFFPDKVSIREVRSSMMRELQARGIEFRELKTLEVIPQDL